MQNQFLPPENERETSAYAATETEVGTTETTSTAASEQVVLELMEKAERNLRRRQKKFRGYAVGLIFTGYPGLTMMGTAGAFMVAGEGSLIPVAIGLAFVLLALGLFRELLKPADTDLKELARIGGRQAVPILLAARGSSNRKTDVLARRSALAACLPLLQASDRAMLSANDRRYFNDFLRNYLKTVKRTELNEAFALAILKAYEQVGDAKAVPVVEYLANINPRTDRQRRIRQAAQNCLPLLRTHVRGMTPAETLLRASGAAATAPDILLRPASADTAIREDELLRATVQDEEEPSV